MIFFNIGDGYSSGCCTANNYFFACDDPSLYGAGMWEHPDNRPGSFVNQVGTLYRANVVTVARHRTTIEEIIDNCDDIIDMIKKHKQESIAFIGLPDLYSQIVGEEYLLLDGADTTIVDEDEYINLCTNRENQDLKDKIAQIEKTISKISNVVDKVIVYRTTAHHIDLTVPDNVIYTDFSIVDYLKDHVPYRRGYYDKSAYKKFSKEFLELL